MEDFPEDMWSRPTGLHGSIPSSERMLVYGLVRSRRALTSLSEEVFSAFPRRQHYQLASTVNEKSGINRVLGQSRGPRPEEEVSGHRWGAAIVGAKETADIALRYDTTTAFA